MRFLNGIVAGFLLAIGVAYWHDSAMPDGPDRAAHELVNWEEFARSASAAGDWVREEFSKLTDSLHRHD